MNATEKFLQEVSGVIASSQAAIARMREKNLRNDENFYNLMALIMSDMYLRHCLSIMKDLQEKKEKGD